ncbi:MAG: hypothetical protein WCL71_11265 [Deltaproteobacteria bacterium]
MKVLKLRYFCRFGSLIAASLIPALVLLFMGNRMRPEESFDSFLKRREEEKVKN